MKTGARLSGKGALKVFKNNIDDIVEKAGKGKKSVTAKPEKVPYNELGGKVEPCFLPGTLVSTISGLKPIELVDKNEKIIVFDFEIRKFTIQNVVNSFKNWATTYFIINTDLGDSIRATSRHMFWIENEQKWKVAKKLNVGDVLKTQNGTTSISYIIRIDDVEVDTFNLEIQDCHNYLVGIDGVLVHNKSKISKFESQERKNIRIYEIYDPVPQVEVEVKYVGQTDKPKVEDRFEEHKIEGKKKKNHKAKWDSYKVREVKQGNWTPYEASVWEQHYIEKNGGLEKNGGKLENKRAEITKKKYDKYADSKYKHNPC